MTNQFIQKPQKNRFIALSLKEYHLSLFFAQNQKPIILRKFEGKNLMTLNADHYSFQIRQKEENCSKKFWLI
jgi:hypothetical protein